MSISFDAIEQYFRCGGMLCVEGDAGCPHNLGTECEVVRDGCDPHDCPAFSGIVEETNRINREEFESDMARLREP